jgi:hypothetical protein
LTPLARRESLTTKARRGFAMSAADQPPPAAAPVPDERREALLNEYHEVGDDFRLLSDIRFRLLGFLPLVALATTGLLTAGADGDDTGAVQTIALSGFGLAITLALATYNARNDQLYDALVGRAASIEWQLGLHDGAFANRPRPWFSVGRGRLAWPVNHRWPVGLIYGATCALWLFAILTGAVQLLWQDDPPPAVLLAMAAPAVLVPALVARRIGARHRRSEEKLRKRAATAACFAATHGLVTAAGDARFLDVCAKLGGIDADVAGVRAAFYRDEHPGDPRAFLPTEPRILVASQFVAQITDLPVEWIHDCATNRRRPVPVKAWASRQE